MTYQQHLDEWDIPLSESSCFSYSHTLKAFQYSFLFNNDVADTCTWQQRFIVLKRSMSKFIMHYMDIVSWSEEAVPINIF